MPAPAAVDRRVLPSDAAAPAILDAFGGLLRSEASKLDIVLSNVEHVDAVTGVALRAVVDAHAEARETEIWQPRLLAPRTMIERLLGTLPEGAEWFDSSRAKAEAPVADVLLRVTTISNRAQADRMVSNDGPVATTLAATDLSAARRRWARMILGELMSAGRRYARAPQPVTVAAVGWRDGDPRVQLAMHVAGVDERRRFAAAKSDDPRRLGSLRALRLFAQERQIPVRLHAASSTARGRLEDRRWTEATGLEVPGLLVSIEILDGVG